MNTNIYQVIPIDEGSWRIEEEGVRSFLFAGSEKALLVDSGYGKGDLKALVAELTKLPVTLVNTHADGDHVGGNAQFGTPWMHPAEFDRYRASLARPAHALWEGTVIDLGGRRFEVVLISGHTPGSIALLDEAHRFLIAGDSIVGSTSWMFGPGRNFPAYIHSMQKLLAMRQRFDVVYPSHGDFPMNADAIEQLVAGARGILDGSIAGKDVLVKDTPVKEYDVGVGHFYYTP